MLSLETASVQNWFEDHRTWEI